MPLPFTTTICLSLPSTYLPRFSLLCVLLPFTTNIWLSSTIYLHTYHVWLSSTIHFLTYLFFSVSTTPPFFRDRCVSHCYDLAIFNHSFTYLPFLFCVYCFLSLQNLVVFNQSLTYLPFLFCVSRLPSPNISFCLQPSTYLPTISLLCLLLHFTINIWLSSTINLHTNPFYLLVLLCPFTTTTWLSSTIHLLDPFTYLPFLFCVC